MLHRDLTDSILRTFYDVYSELGHGFLESVYEAAVARALQDAGLAMERQVSVPVYFRGAIIGSFRADIVVERAVVIELKAARRIEMIHQAQLLNYLRSTPLEVGLILNFGERPTFQRLVFTNDRKGFVATPTT